MSLIDRIVNMLQLNRSPLLLRHLREQVRIAERHHGRPPFPTSIDIPEPGRMLYRKTLRTVALVRQYNTAFGRNLCTVLD